MKAKKIIFMLLLVVAGGKTRACNICHTIDSPDIELVTQAGEKIQLDSQSAPSSNGSVSHFMLACTKDLFTGRVTCTIPEEYVEILTKSRLISPLVTNQDKPTLLSLVFKSSKIGAIIGAIVGSVVGAYLLGKALYPVLRYSQEGQEGQILEFCKRDPTNGLTTAYALPQLLIGHKYTIYPLEICLQWLMEHSPLPKQFREPVVFTLLGTIRWGLSGALVGAIAGPLFLAMNPHQAVSVVLKVATAPTHDCSCQVQGALGTMNNS